MMILPTLQEQNSGLRARLGMGKSGLNLLLGGSLQDEGVIDTFGGGGSIGATARLAAAYKDVRLKQVASGSGGRINGPGGGGGKYKNDPSFE